MKVIDFLGHGAEKAVKAAVLCEKMKTTPRGLRHYIATERQAGHEILYQPGGSGGYFLPSLDPEKAQEERQAFYKVMHARAMCTLKALRPVAQALGVPAGQMSVELFEYGAEKES